MRSGNSHRFALLVGNSKYKDKKLLELVTPEVDVALLSSILISPQIGGFEVSTAINKHHDELRKDIARFFRNKNKDDLLLLYFSGHGIKDDEGNLFLATSTTEYDLHEVTAIPARDITIWMDQSRSKRIVLILDCCYSGSFTTGNKSVVDNKVDTGKQFEGTGYGRIVLTATDALQYAWEGHKIHGDVKNSIFTHYLIEGLKTGQADQDNDGKVTIDELYDYVYEKTIENNVKQKPGKWSYRQQGEIIIAFNPYVRVNVSRLSKDVGTKSLQPQLIKTSYTLIIPAIILVALLIVGGWGLMFLIQQARPTPTPIPTSISTSIPTPILTPDYTTPTVLLAMTSAPTVTSEPRCETITDNLLLKDRPYAGDAGQKLASLSKGTILFALAKNPDDTWIKVSTQTGDQGWIRSNNEWVTCNTSINLPVEVGLAPLPTSTPPQPTPTKELIISLSTNSQSTYQIQRREAGNGLVVGSQVYTDRNYTYNSIPTSLQGVTYVLTANNDSSKNDLELRFDVNSSIQMYVAHSVQQAAKPEWLNRFQDTGESLTFIDRKNRVVVLRVYTAKLSAGPITLGGNAPPNGGNHSMYTVAFREEN